MGWDFDAVLKRSGTRDLEAINKKIELSIIEPDKRIEPRRAIAMIIKAEMLKWLEDSKECHRKGFVEIASEFASKRICERFKLASSRKKVRRQSVGRLSSRRKK